MVEKELKKLSRAQLLEIMLEQSRELDRLRALCEERREQLRARAERAAGAESLAEACLAEYGLEACARQAADVYLQNVLRKLSERAEAAGLAEAWTAALTESESSAPEKEELSAPPEGEAVTASVPQPGDEETEEGFAQQPGEEARESGADVPEAEEVQASVLLSGDEAIEATEEGLAQQPDKGEETEQTETQQIAVSAQAAAAEPESGMPAQYEHLRRPRSRRRKKPPLLVRLRNRLLGAGGRSKTKERQAEHTG